MICYKKIISLIFNSYSSNTNVQAKAALALAAYVCDADTRNQVGS